MATNQKVYARSIIRRLKREVMSCPKKVLFLSPYLTPHTAEAVICEATSEDSEIYTTFSAENFAAGASSIGTVRRLLEGGFHVYHLPDLHAKVVLTKEFASVGSQNLTAGGTRNREVSVALSDEREVEYLRSQIAQWFGDRKLITLEMVEDMEAFLPSLRIKHREFRKAIDAADKDIAEQEDLRKIQLIQEEKRQRVEAAREHRAAIRKRSQLLRAAVQSKQVRTSRTIYTRLVTKDNYGEYGNYQNTYSTLVRKRQDESLLDWWVDDDRHKLSKRSRHLLILLENGRLGWPAMNRTQITHFGTGLDLTDLQQIGGHQYKVECDFAVDERDLENWNVEVKIFPISTYRPRQGLMPSRGPRVVVRGFFSLTDLTIVSLSSEKDDAVASPEVAELYSRIEGDDQEIQRLIKQTLLSPFTYKHNRFGIEAGEFFRGQGEHFFLQLHSLDDHIFLTAEKAN